MKVVLLEKVNGLGESGDVLHVSAGFGRNLLIPKGKALFATPQNIAFYEQIKDDLRKKESDKSSVAFVLCEKVSGHILKFIMQASEDNKLYGSISLKDIAESLCDGLKIDSYSLNRTHIMLASKIKEVGLYDVEVRLHPEHSSFIKVVVGRNDEEVNSMIATLLPSHTEVNEEVK
ncbi:50S ribosomal protein L9 [Candidatus Cyrtobacter comes]|uniref:Large ribosomal subunit protein bL9 n=1 Tax=Candidatus Cyrtobacter comes TaxID=675776 RepID=A0ABU5L8F5_9RICK|nr:50S ribosomal protein L9 [Candidatus Cyrtobacter comes]MDZ5762337.1 50S ribosomal protein L9 [Candidatus Cyrtobacter comes]